MTLLPRARTDVVFCEVDEGAVLLHAAQEIYYGLNGVGAEIWQLLPPVSATIEDVVQTLAVRYPEVGTEQIRSDVEQLLADLEKSGLVEPAA